jgi:hypothetical protein
VVAQAATPSEDGDRARLRLLDPDVDVTTRRALFAQAEAEAVANPDPRRLYVLGSLYRRGDSAREPAFAKDLDKAREYLSRAALAGLLPAMAKRSVLELDAGNRFEANVWAQLYYHYWKDVARAGERWSDGFAASLIAKAQYTFDEAQMPALNDSVGLMVRNYDAKIRAGIEARAKALSEATLQPTRKDSRVLPETMGRRPEAGVAEFYVSFDARGEVKDVWLLDAWPDAALARVLRPIAMSYHVDPVGVSKDPDAIALLPIEYNDLRNRVRKQD